MKSFFCAIFLFTFCISCNLDQRQTNSTKQDIQHENLPEHLETYFNALKDLGKFNGAVLVRKEGKPLLYKAFNMSEDVQNSLFVTEDSQFDIHSISKLMAKACIVKLEKEGLLSRSDLVSHYVPDFPNGEKITIQYLLDNRSGLPRDFEEEYPNLIEKSPAEVIDLIKREDLLFDPGTDAVYSNLGYQIVYFIISEVSKKPFVSYLNEQFFMPLGMKNSGAHFYLDKSNLVKPVQNNILEDDKIVLVPNFDSTSKNQAKVYSTLLDLSKFIDHVSDAPFRSALLNSQNNIGWSGGGDGILSHASTYIDADYDLFFFSNYDEIPFGEILKTVDLIMTGQPFQLPVPISRQAISLEKQRMNEFAGQYRMTEFNNDIFEIRIEKDQFVFYQNGERNSILFAENDSTLFAEPTDEDYFVLRKRDDGNDLVFKYKGIDIVGVKF